MGRVLQEKALYMADSKFKEEIKKLPDLLFELLAM
jgi:hypothetical protein